MNIKPILARLENAFDRHHLAEPIVLLPKSASTAAASTQPTSSVNLVVGYTASTRSQQALDLAMLIAHQTRLATPRTVTLQVVYVIDQQQNSLCSGLLPTHDPDSEMVSLATRQNAPSLGGSTTTPLGQPQAMLATLKGKRSEKQAADNLAFWFEHADRILWQAHCLAAQWRSSFQSHLRFGDVATELRKVVEAEAATLLILGCHSVKHPIIQNLGANFPCSVLGAPAVLG